jgi:peptidoglycan L-alanyl-D-glutamate endopeptidase CwlK
MIDRLHPIVLAKAQQLVQLAKAEGIPIKLTEGYRPPERQAALLTTGATDAKPGYSFHQYGLAFDLVPLDAQGKAWWEPPAGVWDTIGRIGESLGLSWGGRWRPTAKLPLGDRPHFEYHPGFTIQDLVTGAKQVGQLLLERPAIPATVLVLLALGGAVLLLRRRA